MSPKEYLPPLKLDDAPFLQSVSDFIKQEPGIIQKDRMFYNGMFMFIKLRLFSRHIEGGYYKSVEIVNVDVYAAYQGRTIYSQFLQWLEDNLEDCAILVENILNPAHESLYQRRGYAYYGSNRPATMYKLV